MVADGATRKRLERQMFWENYKGSTDLLTRWVYPPIVWPLVLLCTRLRIHPNVVTLVSIAFTIVAVPLFARGDWVAGFLCAYAMSVLDSVDGKVARLTLTDSKIGNLLDHGIDQVHPPFWYFAWAWGLGARAPADPLYQAALWLIFFYFADRIVLAVAKRRLGFALHAATRLDGRVRSWIARRNITMTIMAFALLLGQGPAGFWIVTALARPDVRLACRPYDLARIHFTQRTPGGLMSAVEDHCGKHARRDGPVHRPAGPPAGRRSEFRSAAAARAPGGAFAQEEPVLPARRGASSGWRGATARTSAGSAPRSTGWSRTPASATSA